MTIITQQYIGKRYQVSTAVIHLESLILAFCFYAFSLKFTPVKQELAWYIWRTIHLAKTLLIR